MSNDPAFLFYPGDYLRDTQCLSEKSQVAYDRIMCEHMRNICITKERLNFFTKRLSDDEKEEILSVLSVCDGGFQIQWVAESIEKRRIYSESRRNNRKGKGKKDMISYDIHMENENEIENVIEIVNENEKKKGSVRGKNKPESILEVQAFFQAEGSDQAEPYFDYYESNGWRIGKNPIKDWRAAARNWIRRQGNYQPQKENRATGLQSRPGAIFEAGKAAAEALKQTLKENGYTNMGGGAVPQIAESGSED